MIEKFSWQSQTGRPRRERPMFTAICVKSSDIIDIFYTFKDKLTQRVNKKMPDDAGTFGYKKRPFTGLIF